MRCAACHRRLLEPAYTAPASMGAWVLGPVCLERERAAGRLPPPPEHESRHAWRRGLASQKPRKAKPVSKRARKSVRQEMQLEMDLI